jgi:hypothetical protein
MDRDRQLIVGVALAAILGVFAALVVLLAQSTPQRPTAASQPSGCVTGCVTSPPTGTPPVASVPAPAPPVVEQPAPAAVASAPQPASAPSKPAPVSSVVSPKVAAPAPGEVAAAPPPAAPRQTTPLDEAVTRAVGTVTAAVQQVLAVVTPRAMPAAPALPPGGIEPPSTG